MPGSKTYSKLFIVLVLCLFVSLATWSTTMYLDMVAVAEGEVFPRGRVKKVQHFEGGIVEKIFVKDGDLVSKGDALIKLQLGAVRVNVFDLESQYRALSRKLLRLEARRKVECRTSALQKQSWTEFLLIMKVRFMRHESIKFVRL